MACFELIALLLFVSLDYDKVFIFIVCCIPSLIHLFISNVSVVKSSSHIVEPHSVDTSRVIETNLAKMRETLQNVKQKLVSFSSQSSNNLSEVHNSIKIELKKFNDKLELLESKIDHKLKEDEHLQTISQLRSQLQVSERQRMKLEEKMNSFEMKANLED